MRSCRIGHLGRVYGSGYVDLREELYGLLLEKGFGDKP